MPPILFIGFPSNGLQTGKDAPVEGLSLIILRFPPAESLKRDSTYTGGGREIKRREDVEERSGLEIGEFANL